MNKAIALLLTAAILIPTASAACAENHRIFRISSQTNAHAEDYNGASAYPEEICWAEEGTHTCNGSNTVLRLSSPTNAHVEQANQANYINEICFGDLTCTYKANCGAGETCIATISSTTNAHVSSLCSGAGSYPTKVCCADTGNNPPTPIIDTPAADPTTASIGENINFTGHGEDPDGDSIAAHLWICIDPLNPPSHACPTTGTFPYIVEDPGNAAFTAAGSYWVTYNVQDDKGAWGTTGDVRQIDVVAQSCTLDSINPSLITQNGSTTVNITKSNFANPATFSSISCGDGASYQPGSLSCAGNSCTLTCENYSSTGTFTVQNLVLRDGAETVNCTGAENITVNAAAVRSCAVSVQSDPINVGQGTTIQVNYLNFTNAPAFDSRNCGGGGATFTAGSCGAAGNGNCTYSCGTYSPANTYTIQTTLDDGGTTVTCTNDTVTVNSGNNDPVATPGPDRSTTTGTAITQNGTCTDTDGTITSCNWTAPAACPIISQTPAGTGTANASNTLNISCPGAVTDTFDIDLTATDDDGATDLDTFTLAISAPSNDPPTANLNAAPATGTEPLTVTFTGTCNDPEGNLTSCTIDFGDGNPTQNFTSGMTHTYNTAKNYTATLTATDDIGQTGTDTENINVTPPVFGTNLKITQFTAEPLSFEPNNAILNSMTVKVKNISEAQANIAIKVEVLDPTTNQPMVPAITATSPCGITPVGATCQKTLADFPGINLLNLGSGSYKLSAKAYSGGGTALEDEENLFFIIGRPVAVPELSLAMAIAIALAVIYMASKN